MPEPDDLKHFMKDRLSVNLLATLLAVMLAGIPCTVFAKTLERSCQGAEMIQVEINGKKYTHTEPYSYSAKGVSKGTIPSPDKARERACRDAAKKAANGAKRDKLLSKICAQHPNGRGYILFMGGVGRSQDEKKTQEVAARPGDFECRGGQIYHSPQCGNGKKEGMEECDDGQKNSDSTPNACRTDCTLAECGDATVDRGEQCDDGPLNSDKIPGACRTNCRRAYCGDGVLDLSEDEKCDDGNNDPYDGCHQCRQCVQPKDNLIVTGDTTLCSGSIKLRDPDGNGVIRVTGSNVTLDCRDTELIGYSRSGIGIMVTGSNVVVRGCTVKDFGTGIEVKGPNAVVFDNQVCGNNVDVKKSAPVIFPARNTCKNAENGWSEGGKAGCSNECQ